MCVLTVEKATKKPIKILFVTTWDCACGIFTYSSNLIKHLERQGVDVQVCATTADYLSLVKLARECEADIVHFQHEYGISVPTDALMSIIGKIKSKGHKVVLTTHTEDDGFNIMLDGLPDGVVLHNDPKDLAGRRMFSRFVKIPHGIPELTFTESKAFYRRKYNIPEDAFVIGTCGFMSSDRGQMLETFMTSFISLDKDKLARDKLKPYFNFVMSAHRSDAGGQFSRMIRESLTKVAEQHGLSDYLYVNVDFLPNDEFRERIRTFDVGFSYAKPKVNSNSGSAADIISCGIPLVVNDAQHFNHLRSYCDVAEGDVPDIAKVVYQHYMGCATGATGILEYMGKQAAEAVADLGYSKAAARHIQLYKDLLYGTDDGARLVNHAPVLSKDTPISVCVPNSLWQVLVLWTRLQSLVEDGYKIKLVVQNGMMNDIHILKYVLKGLAEVTYAEVGLKPDKRMVRFQSKSLAQLMSFDVERWLTDGNSYLNFSDFLPLAGIEARLGDQPEQQALKFEDSTLVIVASELVANKWDKWNQLVTVYLNPRILILGNPLTQNWVDEIVHRFDSYTNNISSVVEDTRMCLAICKKAAHVVTALGSEAVMSAMAGAAVTLVAEPEDLSWQQQLLQDLSVPGLRN